jgi:rare lipoprotein A
MTMALLALMPGMAIAEDDDWFQRQFAPAQLQAPLRRAADVVPVPPSPIPAWRTIVVPAPSVASSSQWAAAVRAATGRQADAMAQLKPLTGYAHEMNGIASYYWQEQMTSSGERFNPHELTAAHKTLPLGTLVRVTNVTNGMSTIVRINDRGPFMPGRVIDLSEAAAQQLHMTGAGLARVDLDVVH